MDSAMAKFLVEGSEIRLTGVSDDCDDIPVLVKVDLDVDEEPVVFFDTEDLLFNLRLSELELLTQWVYTLRDAVVDDKSS